MRITRFRGFQKDDTMFNPYRLGSILFRSKTIMFYTLSRLYFIHTIKPKHKTKHIFVWEIDSTYISDFHRRSVSYLPYPPENVRNSQFKRYYRGKLLIKIKLFMSNKFQSRGVYSTVQMVWHWKVIGQRLCQLI